MASASCARAQQVSLNYERLSSMEEPVAIALGDVTVVLAGLLDAPLRLDGEDDGSLDADLVGNAQVSALTQLKNRWRLSVSYFGQYASDETLSAPSHRRYTDNAALSLAGAWGTVSGGNVSGGNVSGFVREGTRRRRGAGNAALAFDDALGGLADWGGGYMGRFGPWVVGAVVDGAAGFDVGATFRRPMDDIDRRLSVRVSRGVHAAADDSGRFDTTAVGGVGEIVYGSTSFDVGVGFERLTSSAADPDRWYVSTGVRGKSGVFGWSIEGHYGRIEGEEEVSAALGAQYDLARGLLANLGLNHARAKVDIVGIRLVDTRTTSAIVSFRYSF